MGGQGGCERRSEVFVRIQKKKFEEEGVGQGRVAGGGGGPGVGGSDQGLGRKGWVARFGVGG